MERTQYGVAPTGEQFTLRHGDDTAVVTEVGATLRSFTHRGIALLEGFDRFELPVAGRGQVLAPWPNRLDRGVFTFSGRTSKAPIDDVANSCANHGTVRWRPFTARATAQNRVSLGCTLLPTPAYPFALDLEVTYHLGRSGLTVTTTATSLDSVPVPFGVGFHPYFAVGLVLDDCELEVRAHDVVPTNERLLPEGPVEGTAGTPLDFTTPRRIGTQELNATLTGLERDLEGRAWAHLVDRWRGRSVSVWMDQTFPYVQIYSGDAIGDPWLRRSALAIEPMTCPPNAMVSGVACIVLEPGQRWSGSFGIIGHTEEDDRP